MMDYWNRSVDINSVYRLTHCPPAINLFLAAMFYCGLPFCQPFLKAATAVSRPLFLWHFWQPTPPPELASPDGTIPRNRPPSDLSHPTWNRLLILIFLCGLTSNLVPTAPLLSTLVTLKMPLLVSPYLLQLVLSFLISVSLITSPVTNLYPLFFLLLVITNCYLTKWFPNTFQRGRWCPSSFFVCWLCSICSSFSI
jgi:hypothetical protein